MKTILLLLITILPFTYYAQWDRSGQFGLYGTAEIPIRSEMPNMSTNFGIGFQFAYKPILRIPVFLEFKGNIGQYNSQKTKETYIFSDESTTVTDVSYSSKMNKLQLGAKIYYTSYERPVRAYVTPQIGYNFMKSKIRIADPEDEDDCRALENKVVHRSGGWTYGGELGVEFDLHELFKGTPSPQNRLYISASYLGSFRKVDYINVRYMEDHQHGVHDGHSQTDKDGRPLTTQFVNVNSNFTHEHKIAEIYNTHLRFISINIGYVWYF